MTSQKITPFNIGIIPADLAEWFGLPAQHPHAGPKQPLPIQCYLISLPHRKVLVDAPAYEFPGDESMLLAEYKGRSAAKLLADAGIPAEAITDVIITHPHLDHTLGLARPAQEPVEPVFPNARHYLSVKDWDSEKMEDVERRPLDVLQRAGLLTLVDGQMELGDGLTIIPAPGETPGHQLLWLKDVDADVYFVGDIFHHPLEFEELGRHPVWSDAQMLEASKIMLAERAASSPDARLFFTHIIGAWRVEHDTTEPGHYKFKVEPVD